MEAIDRLKLLASQMTFEQDLEHKAGCLTPPVSFTQKETEATFVYPAKMPHGKTIKLLKTLFTSVCERDCYYCPFRSGRDSRRATFTPQDFATLFIKLYQAGAVEGMFLSSGVTGGGIRTQDKLLDTVEILRNKLDFRGYIHLKVMPDAERDQVYRAMLLADRISVNLEAPNSERLARLAPHKIFMQELLEPMKWIQEIRQSVSPHRTWRGRWPSTVTQYVVGGSDETDLELLSTTAWLNRNVGLQRAYFSPFKPVPGTPLENKLPTDPLREQRLYQASFLLRDYGFALEELPFTPGANLPLGTDPKLAWAQLNLTERPIEVNAAEKNELLRVPGIGPRGAEAIIRAREFRNLRELSMLKKLGVVAERAAPYILLGGRPAPRQLAFQ